MASNRKTKKKLKKLVLAGMQAVERRTGWEMDWKVEIKTNRAYSQYKWNERNEEFDGVGKAHTVVFEVEAHWHIGGQTEEGFSYSYWTVRAYLWGNRQYMVHTDLDISSGSSSRDCDGPREDHSDYKIVNGSLEYKSSWQRDQYAEAAGY